jgi:hypothetical protein
MMSLLSWIMKVQSFPMLPQRWKKAEAAPGSW